LKGSARGNAVDMKLLRLFQTSCFFFARVEVLGKSPGRR
jgi:hypothetical protein